MNSTIRDLLGGIARACGITARGALKRVTAGSWNKWRGPASSRGGAGYAAKARRRALEREHGVIGSLDKGIPSFLSLSFFALPDGNL